MIGFVNDDNKGMLIIVQKVNRGCGRYNKGT